MFTIRSHVLIRTLKCKAWDFYQLLFYPLGITAAAAVIVLWAKGLAPEMPDVFSFFVFGIAFVLVWVLLTYAVDRLAGGKLLDFVREI